jgi:D-xylulose reductase
MALDLVAAGQVKLKPLITHRYKFEDAHAAFQCMLDGRGGPDNKVPIKCIIAGPEEDEDVV